VSFLILHTLPAHTRTHAHTHAHTHTSHTTHTHTVRTHKLFKQSNRVNGALLQLSCKTGIRRHKIPFTQFLSCIQQE